MILNKNIDLNNIFKDYSLSAITNSYVLSYYSNLKTKYYRTLDKDFTDINDPVYDKETGLQYIDLETSEFNLKTTYKYNENLLTNSMIISNVGNELTTYDGSYIIYYNTDDGLKQLSYHYLEGNGLYYDNKNHVIGLNIDDYTIKEINKKLYFDTNSIPISTENSYGISYVDDQYLTVNNGVLSIKQQYIENVISYKYKIKNLYNTLSSLQSSFSYYNNVYIEKNDTTNFFNKFFNNVLKNDKDNMIDRNISYEISSSLYFPSTDLKYIDNYYINKGLISDQYKQFIPLNDMNSYIIYCKDLEQLVLYSYLENEYIYSTTQFNDNLLNNIENNLRYSSENKSISMVNRNDLYSYIYVDELNNYNKILVKSNIVNETLYPYPINPQLVEEEITVDNIDSYINNYLIFILIGKEYKIVDKDTIISNLQSHEEVNYYKCLKDKIIYYTVTDNKIQYHSRNNDDKIFKKNGIILNSKINYKGIEKCIVDYYLVDNTVNYTFKLKKINIKYNDKNIKILHDDRDIEYCTYNYLPINYDDSKYYFFINLNDDGEDSNLYKVLNCSLVNPDISSNYYYNGIEIEDLSIKHIFEISKASFKNDNMNYLFYGYNFVYNQSLQKFNKKYYSIWNNFPTSYITSNFMESLLYTKGHRNNVLFNIDELYTKDFKELDFEQNEDKNPILDSYKLYLCELSSYLDNSSNPKVHYVIKFAKSSNGENITINI